MHYVKYLLLSDSDRDLTVSRITVSIPLNTGVIGGEVSRIELRLPVNISFDDFMSRVCTRMGLDPQTARLGFKYPRDPRRGRWHDLASEEHLRAAMDRGVGYISRARKRRIVLEIENLVRARLSVIIPPTFIDLSLAACSPYSSSCKEP